MFEQNNHSHPTHSSKTRTFSHRTQKRPRPVGGRVLVVVLLTIVSSLSMSGCASKRQSSGQERRFDLKGKIVSFDKGQQQVIVSHEAIPGYMEAMTMPFTMREDSAYDVMKVGDQLQATLVVDGSRFWMENPIVTQAISSGDPAASAEAPAAEPQPGAAVPDFNLVNQAGEKVGLADYRGRVLLVTFIYTRCPLPEYCTLMSNNFTHLDRELESDPGLQGKARLLSVTIDPERDTPQVLRSYGAAHTGKYGDEKFERWDFLTGQPEEIRKLATFFGLSYTPDGDQIVHSLRTALVSADGKLLKLYRGNEWQPADVLKDVRAVVRDGRLIS